MSNEQAPQTPLTEENPFGLIDQVPGMEAVQIPVQATGGEESVEVKHGGYATGVRVGEMALKISRLQQQGKWAEAQALTDQLDKVSPAEPQQ